jgi:hypothetical protein
MTRHLTVRRSLREEATLEMLEGESPEDARERAIALQADLTWDCYDCEYDAAGELEVRSA